MSSGERLGCTQDTLLPTMITGLQPGAKGVHHLAIAS